MAELLSIQAYRFSVYDYIVFILMTLISTGVGLYYGYYKRPKEKPVTDINLDKFDFGSKAMSEYLLGSRKLRVFPVAMSLIAGYISGVTVLGTPAEIYNYGTQYFLIVVPIFFMMITVIKVYLPVFMTLRVRSSYEYLSMRFGPSVQTITSFLFVMDEIFFLPIIVWVPGIAMNQATGINVHIITGVLIIFCVIYTFLGGIKAVVFTDAWQITVMFVSVVFIVILGSIFTHNPIEVFKSAQEGGRLVLFDTNPSFYERQTMWSVLIGGYTYWTSFNSVNQTMVQRYLTLDSYKKARNSVYIFTAGIIITISFCSYSGLQIYELYKKCDPLSAGLIFNDDQLLPIYVMQTVGWLKGMPGLFLAGVFGAALSSLSTVLNATSLVLLQDIVRGWFQFQLSERQTTILVKGSVIVLGCVAFSLAFILEYLSGILCVATSLTAIAAGTSFGLFTMGMLIPWSNTKGAIAGAIAGALMSGISSIGSQAMSAIGYNVPDKLPLSVEECGRNVTLIEPEVLDSSHIFPLFRLTYFWINPIGILSVLVVGTIVSFITGPTDVKTLDARLISPVIHRFLPKECFAMYGEDETILKEKTAPASTTA